jgi:hypothetical protein
MMMVMVVMMMMVVVIVVVKKKIILGACAQSSWGAQLGAHGTPVGTNRPVGARGPDKGG